MLMSEVVDKPAESPTPNLAAPAVEVFAVYGVEPEIQAYAMAKYSRSALSMKESLREINQQKAEKFLNTFYFQYGHRSIADLAHIALAIEKLSILAAIAVADEQRWDGQERSTRYQDFKKSGYYVPDFGEARWWRRPARRSVREGALSENRRLALLRIRIAVGKYVPLSGRHHAQAGGNEAGGLRPHLAGARLRHLALPAAAGCQHIAGRDRQCANPREPGFALAGAHSQRSSAIGRTVEAGGNLSCVQRKSGVFDESWWRRFAPPRPSWARAPSRNCCAKSGSRRRW